MYGAVIFEKPKSYNPVANNPGYKCIAGQEAERIFGTGELPSNVRFLSNISVNQAYNMQLRNTPKILDDKFLRTATSSIILELGLKHLSHAKQATVIAGLFNNVMELAKTFYRLPENPINELVSGLPLMLGHYQPLITDKHVSDAAMKAVLQFTNCERMITSNEFEFVSLVLPRVNHAKNILAAGLPWDDFEFLNKNQLPPRANRLNWVVNSDLPILARVHVSKVDKSYNHLINWGNGAGIINSRSNGAAISTLNPRDFVTSNEIKILSQFSDIEIEDIAISNTPVETRSVLPPMNNLSAASYSFGLLCENIWCSLARDKIGKPVRSPMSAWLHATDRMECLKYAYQLSNLGFVINGYGYGRITIAVRENQKAALKRAAFDLGLLPSLAMTSDALYSELSDPDSPEQIVNYLYANGYLDELMYLDDQYVNDIKG